MNALILKDVVDLTAMSVWRQSARYVVRRMLRLLGMSRVLALRSIMQPAEDTRANSPEHCARWEEAETALLTAERNIAQAYLLTERHKPLDIDY